MRKTLSVLAIIAALSSSALADYAIYASLSGGEESGMDYCGDGTGVVTISDGSGSSDMHSYYAVYGIVDYSDSVSEGSVNMNGGELNETDIYGGCAYSEGASADNNSVTISGGSATTSHIYGGAGDQGDAKGNSVTITGGTFDGAQIYGGKAHYENGDASNNTVTIAGGTFKNNTSIYAADGAIGGSNVVNLVGEDATLGEVTGSCFTVENIYVTAGAMGGVTTGNTLNVYGKNITAKDIIGMQELSFHLTPNMANGDTMLTLATDNYVTLSGFGLTVSVKCSGATLLEQGDSVNLIHISGEGQLVNLPFDPYTPEVDMIQGVTATYAGTITISADSKDLVLTVGGGSTPSGVKVETNTLKSMTETRTDVAALVNSAADFMATTGVQQAKLAAKVAALTGKDGVAPFVALGGSSMRYNTGSHVDADGFNGALGVAKAFGATTLGIAGEYGISSYKSHVGRTNAKGDSKLYGGALLADWQGKQGWHAESALRLGRTTTDYNAMTALGGTHYTDHASYQGIMLGGGKEMHVSKKSDDTIDLYARYFYGHTNASHTTATSGEGIHFSSVNSHRTMVGARYNHELTDTATLYAGAAWMHEFDGDAHSVIGGFTSPSPSLKGDSGMVEIGTTFAPCSSENILLNLNLQGWTGVQRGITGGAGCTIKF